MQNPIKQVKKSPANSAVKNPASKMVTPKATTKTPVVTKGKVATSTGKKTTK